MKLQEVLSTKSPKIFIDQDGVIANCEQGLADYCGVPLREIQTAGWDNLYWEKLRKHPDIASFFENLGWESNGKKLLNWFFERHIPFTFLTRPFRPHEEECITGKKIWFSKEGLGNIPVIFEADKEKYATTNGQPNILIDDHSGNIDKWNAAGGIGLLYCNKNCDRILQKVAEILGYPTVMTDVKF